MPERWVDEKLNNTANRGCMFLMSFVFFGMLSIQGCFIGQLVWHHADLYNRITDIENRLIYDRLLESINNDTLEDAIDARGN